MNSKNWDVIIVGAGLAGLKAALELKASGKQVLVLEARDRVGGRCKAGEICGNAIDLGGQWVGPNQHLLLEQAKAVQVETYPQYTHGENLLYLNHKITQYRGDIPRLPILSLLELGLLEQRWKRQIKSLNSHKPWLGEKAKQWDSQSIESWLKSNVFTRATREFVRIVTRALLCAEPDQVSYLCLLEYMRQGQGLESLINTTGGAQQDKFVGGAWQIPYRMSQQLNDNIVLNSPVTGITQDDTGVEVTTTEQAYTCQHVIVATPPGLAAKINYTPTLPSQKWGLLQRMPMGAVIKVHIAYAKPFWRAKGLTGAVVSDSHHFNILFDQSPEDESIGALVGFLDGKHAIEMSSWSEQDRQAQVTQDLIDYFGEDAATPIAYIDQDWTQEEWSLGGYVAHMPPGVLSQFGEALRKPVGRIHWAGTETAQQWCGYFDGALESGIRAANEVLQAQGC